MFPFETGEILIKTILIFPFTHIYTRRPIWGYSISEEKFHRTMEYNPNSLLMSLKWQWTHPNDKDRPLHSALMGSYLQCQANLQKQCRQQRLALRVYELFGHHRRCLPYMGYYRDTRSYSSLYEKTKVSYFI